MAASARRARGGEDAERRAPDARASVRPGPTILVLVGAGGDLAQRKLVPALYNLHLDGWLPDRFAVIGLDRKREADAELRRHYREGVDAYSRRGRAADADWAAFAPMITCLRVDLSAAGGAEALVRALAEREQAWGTQTVRAFYLAVPPTAVEGLAQRLGEAGLARDRARSRLVVEKPFGEDLASARALNAALTRVFDESQIYRIDHYLGKETVQNILALRFGNALFEPVWNRRYIDHVQITVAEAVGVEHRGRYYDASGALRDMVENHLLQMLCLVAMEPPVTFEADEIRNKKVDVLRAIRRLTPERVPGEIVRGQYGAGAVDDTPVPAYAAEPDVAPDSATETFVAARFPIDNWRWEGVPFYVRTGKRLPAKATEVVVQFRPAPHQPFPAQAVEHWRPNRLVLRIQPAEGILLRFQAKRPGPVMHLDPVNMEFDYARAFHAEPPEGYEMLLLDVMRGDATLFMRADQVEAAWSVVQPVLDAWRAGTAPAFPNYAAGTWGPPEADALLAKDGRAWALPTVLEDASGPAAAAHAERPENTRRAAGRRRPGRRPGKRPRRGRRVAKRRRG